MMPARKRNPSPTGWNEVEFAELLEAFGVLSPEKAKNCAFQVRELLECCQSLIQRIDDLTRGLRTLKENSFPLYYAASVLPPDLQHFRWHMKDASRALSVLPKVARQFPPLSAMDEEEIGRMFLREAQKPCGKATKEAAAKRTRTAQRKKKQATLSRSKTKMKIAKKPRSRKRNQ